MEQMVGASICRSSIASTQASKNGGNGGDGDGRTGKNFSLDKSSVFLKYLNNCGCDCKVSKLE